MRIGTVGTNFIVSTFIDAVQMTDGASVEIVYSRTEENARRIAQKHGIKRTCTDMEAFLTSDEIDFVYIALPNSLHYEWTKRSLLAGKNVICEKPFVPSCRQLAELMAIARAKSLFLFEEITVPHLPNYRLLKQHLHKIGKISMIRLNYSQYSTRYKAFLRGEKPNVFTTEYAGGALMDLNYYNLNFLLGIFETPDKIEYFPTLAPNGIDLSGVLVFTYPDKIGVAVACKDCKCENLQVLQGDCGYIQLSSPANTLAGGFAIVANDGEVSRYDEQPIENPLFYALQGFADIYRKKDTERRDLLLDYNYLVSEKLESVRLKAGIRFPSDEESV